MSGFVDFGTDLDTRQPVRMKTDTLVHSNSIALGRKGTGKSTLWLLRLFVALLAANVPIIIFDGARWSFLYHVLRMLAEASGRKFRVIFDTPRYLGSKIDLFHHFRNEQISVGELASLLFNASGVPYTKAYGIGYYGLISFEAAQKAAEAILRERTPITLPAMVEGLDEIARGSRDTEQVRAAMRLMASHDVLAEKDDGSPGFVRWDEVDREKQVVLVSWKASNVASSFFATGVHNSLVSYAYLVDELGGEAIQRQVIADEWHMMLGPTFTTHLTEVRKHGLSHHLMNQSRFQLDYVDPNLAKVVLDQVDLEIHFSLDPLTQEYVQSFSKMTGTMLKGRTVSTQGLSLMEREYMERVLEINSLLDVSSTFGAALVVSKVQEGFREPFKVYMEHLINRETYDYLESLPFPRRPEPPTPPAPPPIPGWRGAPKDDDFLARQAAIGALLAERRAREGRG